MFSKINRSLLVGIVCTVSLLCFAIAGVSQLPQADVQLVTEPPIAQVTPLEAEATHYLGSGKYNPPVQIQLQARDASGSALQNARFHLQVQTPAPTPWFTTDFPIVEGTKLLDITADAPTGAFQMQQVFPIRGTYQLAVDVTPIVPTAFAPIAQTLSLTVPENPLKFRYFPIVLAVLLAIGFVGGWVIGGRQIIRPGEIAPRRVRLLLSGVTLLAIATLLFFNISAEVAQASMSMSDGTIAPTATVRSQGMKLELTGDTATQVGKTAALQAQLTDAQTNQPIRDAVFSIQSTQAENNWVAFAYEGAPDANGSIAWQQQFFDGAPHQIAVTVSPSADRSFQPFQVMREIAVEGIAPPLQVRLIGLMYFTGVLAIGLSAGIWVQRRRLAL